MTEMLTMRRTRWGFKTLVRLAGLSVCTAFADEAMVKGVSWEFEVIGDTACILRPNQVCTGNLVVPDKIGKCRVTGIGAEAFNINPGPKSIKIPASVTSIGEAAFLGNMNLTAITLPPKLTCIEKDLFIECRNLAAVKIPASVRSIGVQAFADCRSLKTVKIPEGVASIGNQAFRDCSNLASVTIPASVTNVGEMAFIRCGKLAKIDVAKGGRAYKSVAGALYTRDGTTLVAWPAGSSAAAVAIPDGVTGIGSFAFADCPKITSISMPASVTNIEDGAFVNCPKLTTIYADAGDLDRLQSVIAVHNPKSGQMVEGRSYKADCRDQMDKIAIKEKMEKK